MGEFFRRPIAKRIGSEDSSEAVELFSSRQLGVAVKCGAESTVQATKQTLQKLLNNEKAVPLQIDFKKAFNSITRSSVLDAAQKFIPALAPFASFSILSIASSFLMQLTFKVSQESNMMAHGDLTVFFRILAYYQKT